MTTFSDASCPEPAVLGAYIDGTLSRERVEGVTRHVTRCAKCRRVVEDVVRIEAEHQRSIVVRPHFARKLAWAAAAVVVVAMVVSFFRAGREPAARHSIEQLVVASPRSERSIEARISGGFPWAPFRGIARNPVTEKSREELRASGVAGKVLREIGNDRDPQSLHAAGVAYLVSGDADSAVKLLTEASRGAEGNARVWSDLSAALYTSAAGADAVAFRRALDAADRAIRLNPRLAEAHFNRAIALEQVGTPQQVEAAWRDYVARFPDRSWAAEARERLERRARP